MKKLLSDFVCLFLPIEEGKDHNWGTIAGVFLFIGFIALVLSLSGS